MTKTKGQSGFTLIELLLAMTFIAFLLIFTVAAILQVTRLYIKGSAIRQIDQTGRQLIDDVSTTLRTGADPNDQGVLHNRLCVGGTSYVWNVDGSIVNANNVYSDSSATLRFVSVQDPHGDLCRSPSLKVTKSTAVDLIGPEITPLSFSVTQHGSLWDISVVLSTTGENKADPVVGGGFACKVRNQFCAFGNFETSTYSRGGGALL